MYNKELIIHTEMHFTCMLVFYSKPAKSDMQLSVEGPEHTKKGPEHILVGQFSKVYNILF